MAKRRRLLSAQECSQEWKAQWEMKDHSFLLEASQDKVATTEDPFDCSSLISHEKQLVEREITDAILKWRALEDRKIKKHSLGWAQFKIRLPLKFDYQSKLSQAPPSDSRNSEGERVISLINPAETVSYETELWKIFKQTRTIEELARVCKLNGALFVKDRMDKTDLTRLRISDRHGLPPPVKLINGSPDISVVLEIWRRNLPERAAMDSNRMVLEFLGDQTLLDVHTAIQELTDDILWTGGKSGLLFIEDTFYTTGEVDYTTNILDWMKEDKSRYEYLGISEKLKSKPMASVKLKDLQWCLNVRYAHIHHGHVESSLFLTDICQTSKHALPYPIMHDAWTPTYSVTLCEGCKQRSATLVTPATCEETDGAAHICQSCHDSLFNDADSKAMNVHMFKQQHDLVPPGKPDSSF